MRAEARAAAAPAIARRGVLFVLSSPSGAGKTTLAKRLLAAESALTLSVSATTRPMRAGEVDGKDYHFVSGETFSRMVEAGELLEHADVFGARYGTPRGPVEDWLAAGRDVLFDVDWQGARQVRAAMPQCRSIFILPPSRDALRQRLTGRQTDSQAVIERRLADAVGDMSHWREFDYVVVNDDFERAAGELVDIVQGRGEGLRAGRPELSKVLADLLGQSARISNP